MAQPYRNHNGGMIAFGPDGYLYIGMGDGGGAGDPDRTGQDPASLLGAILRISVDGDPYSVPPNPWAGDGGAAEVWAKGLRNPWRFSFDGDLIYIGDVGQDAWEEIDIAHVDSWRLNFGWSVMEGTHCFREPGCDRTGLEIPVLEYPHEDGNCSVTGGYVYRGAALPELDGSYFYGDYCSGMIASFRRDLEGLFDLRDWTATLGALPGPHLLRHRWVRRVAPGDGRRGRSTAWSGAESGPRGRPARRAADPGPPATGPAGARSAAAPP